VGTSGGRVGGWLSYPGSNKEVLNILSVEVTFIFSFQIYDSAMENEV